MSKFGKNAESSYKSGPDQPADNNVLRLQFPSTPAEAQQRVNDLLTDADSPLTHRNAATAKFDAAGNKGQVLPEVLQEFAKAENLADRFSNDRSSVTAIRQAIENDKRYVKAERGNGIWHAYDQTLKDLLDSSALVRVSHALRLLETARTEGNAQQRQQLNKQATKLLVDATRFDRNITDDPRLQAKIAEQLKQYQAQGGVPADLQQDLAQAWQQIQALQNGQDVPVAPVAQSSPSARTEATVGDSNVRRQQPGNGQTLITDANKGWLAIDLAQTAVQTYTDNLKHGARPVDALAATESAFQQAMTLAGNVHDPVNRPPVSEFQKALDPAQEKNLSPGELAVVRQFKNNLDPISGQSCPKTELAKRAELAYNLSFYAPEMVRTLHAALLLKTAELEMRQLQPNSADYNKCARIRQQAASQLQQLANLGTLALPREILKNPSQQDAMIQYAQNEMAANAAKLRKPVLAAVSPAAPVAQESGKSLTVPPVGYNKNTFKPPVAPPAPGVAADAGNRVGDNRQVAAGPVASADASNKVGDNQPAKPMTPQDHLQLAVNEFQQTKNINHQEFQSAIQESHKAIVDKTNAEEAIRDGHIKELIDSEAKRVAQENKIGDSKKQLQTVTEQLQRYKNLEKKLGDEINADRIKLEADKKSDPLLVANFFHKLDGTDIDAREAALNGKEALWDKYRNDVKIWTAKADTLNKSIAVDATALAKQVGDIAGIRDQIKHSWSRLGELRAPVADAMYKYGTALVANGNVGDQTQKLLVNAGAYDPKLLDKDDFKQALQKSGLDAATEIKKIRDAQSTDPHPCVEARYAFDCLSALGYADSKKGLQQAIDKSGTIDAERLRQLDINLQNAKGKPEEAATARMDLLAPYISRLAMAAAAKQNNDTATFNSMLQQINSAAIPASVQPVVNKAIEYAKRGELISEKQILEPMQAVRSVQPNQGTEIVPTGGAKGVVSDGGAGKTKGPDVLGVAKETTLQVGGDIGTGWLGWAATPVIAAGLTVAVDAAIAAAVTAGVVITAPAWGSAAVVAAVGTVAVVGGVAITIGAKSAWNNLTNTGEKDWHKSMYSDAFNYGTFGASTAVKFVGKHVIESTVVKAILKEAPAVGRTMSEFGLFGKEAKEAAKLEQAAREAIKQKAEAAAKEAFDKVIAARVPVGKLANAKALKVAERAGKMARGQVERAGEIQIANEKAAKIAIANMLGTPHPYALKVSGMVRYAGDVAKQVPVALATSTTYATGKYIEDRISKNLDADTAGRHWIFNSALGTVGGSAIGPAGRVLGESIPAKFAGAMGKHAERIFGQPITSIINNNPILKSYSLANQEWSETFKPSPEAWRTMTTQGTARIIGDTSKEIWKIIKTPDSATDTAATDSPADQPANQANQPADPILGSPNNSTQEVAPQPIPRDSKFPLGSASEVTSPTNTSDQSSAADAGAQGQGQDQSGAGNPNAQGQLQNQSSAADANAQGQGQDQSGALDSNAQGQPQNQSSAADANAQGQTQVSPSANGAASQEPNYSQGGNGNASPDTSNQGGASVGP